MPFNLSKCAAKPKTPCGAGNCRVDYGKPKGKLDTQLFPECKGTEYDRDIVNKNRKRKEKIASHHCEKNTCPSCGSVSTCRCTTPKTVLTNNLCYECNEKRISSANNWYKIAEKDELTLWAEQLIGKTFLVRNTLKFDGRTWYNFNAPDDKWKGLGDEHLLKGDKITVVNVTENNGWIDVAVKKENDSNVFEIEGDNFKYLYDKSDILSTESEINPYLMDILRELNASKKPDNY